MEIIKAPIYDHWCRCCSCGQRWKYTERFTLDTAWIDTEEED